MRRMMMMKKIDGLNNEKGKRKWQSMVLEMKIEEIVCSKKEVPARSRDAEFERGESQGRFDLTPPSLSSSSKLGPWIDIPVCLRLTLVKQTQFHLSQIRMLWVEHLHGLIYDDTWGIREMSQSLSNDMPDNSPEQEAATGHSIPRRLDSPTPQATQLPGLELTLTPATGRELSQEINNHTSETSKLNLEDVTARLEALEVEIDTLHADVEDKELLISELQDSLAAVESEISLLLIRVDDAESRRVEDHEQIQTILAHLGL
ncbi:hypothetical protein Tco_1254305 [Tanacetum coccineum]